jgi:SAM-dependent methyltransferase
MNTCHPEPHDSRIVDIDLKGYLERLPDAAPFPAHLAQKFQFAIYAFDKYANTEGLCPADDVVSFSLSEQGVWEAFDTLLMLDILSKGKQGGLVVDFGSQLGWYSILAALNGYKVIAYDTLPENMRMLDKNAKLNKVSDKITPILEWVDETSQILPPTRIRFMKSDIEGNEEFAFRMYEESFKKKLVDYAIFEISPCFNDSYPALIHKVMDYGYKVYQVPQKTWEHWVEFGDQPLETTLKYPIIEDMDKHLANIRQENFLFVRDDL